MTAPPPSGWREVELRDLITELDAGVSVNSEDRPIQSGEVGVLKTSCVTTGTFDASQHKAVIAKDVERVATPVQPDRIIMSRMNTAALVGASAYVERNVLALYLPDRLWQFGGRQGVADSRWLGYVLSSRRLRQVFSRIATGTSGSMKNLTKEQVRSLKVLLPPLAEQREIAATLKAVDGAIAADEVVVEQLDRVRGAVVEHLLEERPRSREEGTAAWRRGVLAEHLREPIRNGYSPVCPAEPTGRWTLSLSAVTPEGFNPGGKKPAPVDDPQVEAARLLPGDVLVSRSNTRDRVGLAGVYVGDPPECSYPDLLMRVRTGERVLPEFLECQLLARRGRRYFQSAARGTSGSMLKINREILEAFPVVVPPLEEQRRIRDSIRAVTNRIERERAVVAERRRIKAALADALLSGRLRVRNAA